MKEEDSPEKSAKHYLRALNIEPDGGNPVEQVLGIIFGGEPQIEDPILENSVPDALLKLAEQNLIDRMRQEEKNSQEIDSAKASLNKILEEPLASKPSHNFRKQN